MPYIPKEKRAAGAWVGEDAEPRDDIDWSVPQPAELLKHRRLPVPDQSRYGTAKTDPPPYNLDGTIRRRKGEAPAEKQENP